MRIRFCCRLCAATGGMEDGFRHNAVSPGFRRGLLGGRLTKRAAVGQRLTKRAAVGQRLTKRAAVGQRLTKRSAVGQRWTKRSAAVGQWSIRSGRLGLRRLERDVGQFDGNVAAAQVKGPYGVRRVGLRCELTADRLPLLHHLHHALES